MARTHRKGTGRGQSEVIQFTAQEEIDQDAEETAWAAGAEQRARDALLREVPARVAAAEREILRNEVLLDPGPNGVRKVALQTWLNDIENFPTTAADPSAPGSWPVKPA